MPVLKGSSGEGRRSDKSPSFARIDRLKPAPPKQSELRSDGQGGALCHGVLNRFGDTTNGKRIPRGKPWDSHRISGKQRPESGGCPGFAGIAAHLSQNG